MCLQLCFQVQHTIPVALNVGTSPAQECIFLHCSYIICKSLLICACRCCHINILQLLGFSVETGLHCLIYPYLPNGSLQNKLQCHVSNNLGLPPTCDCKSSPGIQGKTIASLLISEKQPEKKGAQVPWLQAPERQQLFSWSLTGTQLSLWFSKLPVSYSVLFH